MFKSYSNLRLVVFMVALSVYFALFHEWEPVKYFLGLGTLLFVESLIYDGLKAFDKNER